MRWVLAAALLPPLAGACRGATSNELAACLAAERTIGFEANEAAPVIALCDRAYRRTHADDALIARTRARLIAGEFDGVLAEAAQATGTAAPRLWQLAGDAELERGRSTEARGWYERALEGHRGRDPKRAANASAMLAEIALQTDALDEAIAFQYQASELAGAADRDARALTTLNLIGLLLDVGDVPAARAALSAASSAVTPGSPFENEYYLASGDLDTQAGRPAAAKASYSRCIAGAVPHSNPRTQLACLAGRAALVADGLGDGTVASATADLTRAAEFVAMTNQAYGVDPDRDAWLLWLRARVDLRDGKPVEAERALGAIDLRVLGPAMRSRVRFALGELSADNGFVPQAEEQLVLAAGEIEHLRDGAHYREIRRSLPRELRAPYELLFVLRAGAGDAPGAIAAMERALTRDFVDRLAASVPAGDDDAATAGGVTLDRRVADAQRRVRALRQLDARPDVDIDLAAPRPATVGFFAAEGGLWRVRLGGPAPRIDRVAGLDELAPLVAAMRSDPTDPAAARLRTLLLPDAILPPADALLVIVPDTALEGVRFSALRDARGFLVERNPLLLAPSLAVRAPVGPAVTSPGGSGDHGPPVVLGDPDGTLPGARAEAEQVAALYGVPPLLGAAAGRDAVAAARRAAVLHVASHGSARDDGTIISLAGAELGTADVLELGLAPDLAVVASCASATTRPDALWTSLAAALVASGAGAVVGALGSIPDDVARDIVLDVHRAAAAEDPPHALARALRLAIARGVPVSAWSSFAVLGRVPAGRT